MRSPRARSVVHTEAPRPNSESLARSIASSSDVDGDHRDHRAEDLLAHDPHVVGHAGEHRRGEVVGLGRAAGSTGPPQRSSAPSRHGVVDQLAHELELLARDHRADLRRASPSGRPPAAPWRRATSASVKRSATSRTTYTRSMPEQVWPAFAKPPHSAPDTAFGRLASASTSIGSLPPSSSTEPFIRSAQATPTPRPTSTEPVKKILAALDSTSAWPDGAAAVHGRARAPRAGPRARTPTGSAGRSAGSARPA